MHPAPEVAAVDLRENVLGREHSICQGLELRKLQLPLSVDKETPWERAEASELFGVRHGWGYLERANKLIELDLVLFEGFGSSSRAVREHDHSSDDAVSSRHLIQLVC